MNAHPSKVDAVAWKTIDQFIAMHPNKKVYFVPCDMVHDMSFIQEIEERYPKWELYDWT
jgi:peroxiredoxin family protein